MIIMPEVTAPACHVLGITPKTTFATRTIAEISIMLRTNSAVFRYRGGSSTILRTRCAPGLPSSTSRSARAFENDDRAASAAADNPAKIISAKAMPSWSQYAAVMISLLVGETEHLRVVFGGCMVVTQQVQQPVHQQVLGFLVVGALMLARLSVGHL